ncbi:MAG: GNAT family N-acetyltransferase [Spirochaetaceae bacterium]
MIHLIEQKNYYKVKELVGDFSHGIFPSCVCDGNNPGWIFADDPENPTSAFVYMKKLGGTLVGDSENDEFNRSVKDSLDSLILTKLIKEDEEYFSVTGSNPAWNSSIKVILSNRDFDTCSVLRYKLKEIDNSVPTLGEGYEVKEITTELLKNSPIKNISILTDDILTWWDSLDSFIDKGCGFVALKDNTICGWSYSVCIVDSRVEIYIETVKDHQNRGIGAAIAHRFVYYCQKNSLKPEWEAMSDIKHSIRIAEKVGFEFDYEYKLYEFKL